MENETLIPDLYRTEYRKIVSVLCRRFGFECIEIAEDIASDTFMTAAETWGQNGLPDNPTSWLYAVAKNNAKNYVDGGKVIQGYLRDDCIDELIVTKVPVLIGSGIPLFGSLGKDLQFKHNETNVFSNGLVKSHYERLRA